MHLWVPRQPEIIATRKIQQSPVAEPDPILAANQLQRLRFIHGRWNFSPAGADRFQWRRRLWLIIQPWPQPALDFFQRQALAPLVIGNLIAPDFADGKIFGFRVS